MKNAKMNKKEQEEKGKTLKLKEAKKTFGKANQRALEKLRRKTG